MERGKNRTIRHKVGSGEQKRLFWYGHLFVSRECMKAENVFQLEDAEDS